MFFVIFLQSSYSHYKPFQKQACFYRRLIDWGRGYGVIGSPLYSFRDLSGTHHDGIVTMLILSLNVILTRNMLLQYEINIFFFYQQNLCDTWGIKNVLYDYGLYDSFVAPLLINNTPLTITYTWPAPKHVILFALSTCYGIFCLFRNYFGSVEILFTELLTSRFSSELWSHSAQSRGGGSRGNPWYLILLWIRDPQRDEPLISITNMQDKQVYLSSQEMSAEHRRAQGDSWDAVYSNTTLVIWSFYYCQGQQNSCSWDNIFCCAAEVSATKTFTPYNACRAKRKHE